MTANHHPDIKTAVQNFLQHFESLSRLPLVTDAEMDLLFGAELNSALFELNLYNQQEKLCHLCRGQCCLLVDCELYVPEFGCCSIYKFRPLLCRFHFCHRFDPVYKELVKTVGNIFLESLLAVQAVAPKVTLLLDSPPLGKLAPDLINAVMPHIIAFKEGRLGEAAVLTAINAELEKG